MLVHRLVAGSPTPFGACTGTAPVQGCWRGQLAQQLALESFTLTADGCLDVLRRAAPPWSESADSIGYTLDFPAPASVTTTPGLLAAHRRAVVAAMWAAEAELSMVWNGERTVPASGLLWAPFEHIDAAPGPHTHVVLAAHLHIAADMRGPLDTNVLEVYAEDGQFEQNYCEAFAADVDRHETRPGTVTLRPVRPEEFR